MSKVYHYDDEFEGKRLVDELVLEDEDDNPKSRKVLVHSPKLRANILVYKNRLIGYKK